MCDLNLIPNCAQLSPATLSFKFKHLFKFCSELNRNSGCYADNPPAAAAATIVRNQRQKMQTHRGAKGCVGGVMLTWLS